MVSRTYAVMPLGMALYTLKSDSLPGISMVADSGVKVAIFRIVDNRCAHPRWSSHTRETTLPIRCTGGTLSLSVFFWQKKSFQKVSSPTLHQKNTNSASETTKTQAEHEPSNGSHESWAQIRWILWADLDLEGSGEYTLIWQIYGKYHIVHNLSKVYLNWVAVFHPAVE